MPWAHPVQTGGLPGWATTLFVLGAVAGIVVVGRFVVRPVFRVIARLRLREPDREGEPVPGRCGTLASDVDRAREEGASEASEVGFGHNEDPVRRPDRRSWKGYGEPSDMRPLLQ